MRHRYLMIDFDAGNGETRKMPPIGAFNLVLIALVIGVLSIVFLVPKIYAGCAVFGALGLMLGGYAMGYVHRHGTGNVKVLFAMSGASLLCSVIGFMLGFIGLAGSL